MGLQLSWESVRPASGRSRVRLPSSPLTENIKWGETNMSKMKEPVIEVIRFKEADVIVASGFGKHAILSGWGDNVDYNASITFKDGGNKTSYDWLTLFNEAMEGMLSDLSFFRDGEIVSLNDLATDEDLSSKWNGRYKKGKDGKWYWKGRQ